MILAAKILLGALILLRVFGLGVQCAEVYFGVEIPRSEPAARLGASILLLPLTALIYWLAWRGIVE